VCTARTGQFKAVDPQYEQKIRGTQAWLNQSYGTTGVDDVGSTVATQRPQPRTSMQYQVTFWTESELRCAAGGGNPCPNPELTYMALARRETTGDLTEFTSGRCRYDQNLWNSIPIIYVCPFGRCLLVAGP
jgi:hypothetical protein